MPAPFGSYPYDASGIDLFAHPLFINAMRAPSTNDIYNPGTQWMDGSVSPKVIYQTVGGGVWPAIGGAGTFTTLAVTGLSTLGALTQAGTASLNATGAAVTTIGTGGTGAVNIGNATGNTAITGDLVVTETITSGTGITSTTGDITATNGNVILNGAAKQLRIEGGAVTDFIGTGTLIGGQATILNTNIAATDRILITRSALNASPALGSLIYTINAGVSFVVNSFTDAGAAAATDVSSFTYLIVRQL